MPHAPTSKTPKPLDHETVPSPADPAPEANGNAEAVDDRFAGLPPEDRKVLELFSRALERREEQADAETKKRLEDENVIIDTAARRLTGLPLASGPAEKRLLVKYRLQEFFAALRLPPGLDGPSKEALRHEALTMLFRLGPQDDVERMMLIQLIASHMAGMTCFACATATETSPQLAIQSY